MHCFSSRVLDDSAAAARLIAEQSHSSVVLVAQETRDQVDRKRENDGRVLLRRNGVECLQEKEHCYH